MSATKRYNIPCPKCKTSSEQVIVHSLNEKDSKGANAIYSDEINRVTCPNCKNKFQVKTHLLYCNHSKGIALFYSPKGFEMFEKELSETKRMFGKQTYLSNPMKFTVWNSFKTKVGQIENLEVPKKIFDFVKGLSTRSSLSFSSWSCDICGGTSSSGCMYFDPTECPKFT